MKSEVLQAIFNLREQVVNLWTSSFDNLQQIEDANGVKFDVTQSIPGINGSLSEIDSRLTGLADLIGTFEGVEDLPLIPTNYLSNLHTSLSQVHSYIEGLGNTFDKVAQGGGLKSLNVSNFTAQTQNGQSIEFQSSFQNINNSVDSSLHHYYMLAVVINGDGYKKFSSSFAQFSKGLETVRKGIKEVDKLKNKAEKEEKQIQGFQENASNLDSQINNLKGESEKSRKNIAEYEAEVTQKRAIIQEIATQAETLKTSVKSYQAQFENFQNQIDKREETFTKGKENLDQLIQEGQDEKDDLIEKLKEIEDEIARLNKQAEDMLKGATVAGLASSFGEIRDNLTKELDGARRIFYVSIAILFLSAIPLMAYVTPGLEILGSASGKGDLGGIIIRAILLIPAAWFAKFAASRHAALFRLKEHYVHKYSVASSVEGFKKQADPFKDAIAAATFFELTFNPANQMETKGHEQRHPNKVMDWIMEKLGATYDGKSS